MKKFACGIIVGLIGIPVMESLCEACCIMLEVPKGYFSKKVMHINKEITELQGDEEEVHTQVIGFQYSGDEETDPEDC